jgi:hypothetical protein
MGGGFQPLVGVLHGFQAVRRNRRLLREVFPRGRQLLCDRIDCLPDAWIAEVLGIDVGINRLRLAVRALRRSASTISRTRQAGSHPGGGSLRVSTWRGLLNDGLASTFGALRRGLSASPWEQSGRAHHGPVLIRPVRSWLPASWLPLPEPRQRSPRQTGPCRPSEQSFSFTHGAPFAVS